MLMKRYHRRRRVVSDALLDAAGTDICTYTDRSNSHRLQQRPQPSSMGAGGGDGESGDGAAGASSSHQHHVRGTPYHVRPGLARLALVVAAVFLAFPALSTPLFRSINGAERFPSGLVMALLVSGAGAWAAAAFTASSAWLSIGLGLALGTALAYLKTQGLVPSTLSSLVAAPLVVAGVVSHPALSPYDPLLAVGLLAGAGSQGVFSLKGSSLPAEVSVLVAGAAMALLASPGLIGHDLSRAFSPLSSYTTQGLAVFLSLVIACVAPPSIASALIALLTAALLAAQALSRPVEFMTDAARENARASHWLLAGLLASLAAVTSDAGGLACLGLLVIGAGVAVLVTALLVATAAVWGPVRSGEFQMVTLDFLALGAYFVAPLLFVWYMAAEQLQSYLPHTLPAALAPHVDLLSDALAPLLLSHPLGQVALLALLVSAAQETLLEGSSVIWAHWLIRAYTLGALDTQHVALVMRLSSLLPLLPPMESEEEEEEGERLAALLNETGVTHLNVLVSLELVTGRPGVCTALSKAGHTLGLETAAGPFTVPSLAAAHVSEGHAALQHLLSDNAAIEGGYTQGLSWYAGQGGHRNPWALWRASSLNLHLVAPQHRVTLGDNAGRALRAALDPWCRGGIVEVVVSSMKVDLRATLTDVAARAKEGGYVLEGLAAVCPEVPRMVLSTEED